MSVLSRFGIDVRRLFGAAQPSLAAYGKLPFYEDFLRFRCLEGSAQRFSQWIDAGYALLANAKRELPPMHLLALLPGEKGTLIATLQPSTDRGGLRAFPFATWTSLSPRTAGSTLGLRVFSASQVLSALEGVRHRLAALDNLQGFYAEAHAARLNAALRKGDALWHELATAPCSALVEAIPTRSWKSTLAGRLHHLEQQVQQTLESSLASDLVPPLRVPLNPELPLWPQVSLWVDVIEAQGWSRRLKLDQASSISASPDWLMIWNRALRPRDFLHLAAPEAELREQPEALAAAGRTRDLEAWLAELPHLAGLTQRALPT